MRKLAIVNQKGGAGKTTVAVHLVYRARELGLRVLLVDLDSQGSASLTFTSNEGASPGLLASNLFSDVSTGLQPELIEESFGIIRSDKAALQLLEKADQATLRKPLERLRNFDDDFDLCVIDTPGSIGFNPPITAAALIAADTVLCPCPVGLYESQALAELWEYINRIKTQGYNPRLRLMGLLPSKVNLKSDDEVEGLAQLRKALGSAIMAETLVERTAVKKAIARRRPVWLGTKGAGHLVAAKEWRNAMDVILKNLGVGK